MRKKIVIIILLLAVPFSVIAQNVVENESKKDDQFIGNWTIDLRPTPEAEAYFQPFEVKSIEGNTFHGTFYGSEIKNGLLNKHWSKIYFAFSTSDQSNEYFHSGYVENDILYGITYCISRELAAPWTGTKKLK